ncbi:MAG: glycosyltransferase [Gemmatimonadaceae bacterium]|nr:glycosyltransferase [Gemmatimonadaceae bacterium]
MKDLSSINESQLATKITGLSEAADLPRVLFVQAGPAPPPSDPATNMFAHLSRVCQGDVVTVSWLRSRAEARVVEKQVREANFRIGYQATYTAHWPFAARMLWQFLFFVTVGLYNTLRYGRYDLVFTYGPFKTGLAGWLVARLSGAKLVIDMPVNPNRTWTKADTDRITLEARIKRALADLVVPFLVRTADAVKLLYPNQLPIQETAASKRVFVFHDFTSISGLLTHPTNSNGQYILSLGHPFHRKGVDLLLRAFNAISAEFPNVELRVVGHCPDLTPYLEIAAGNPAIKFLPGVRPEEARELIANCRVFVLASRTEGLARVLLEAMAAARPIVATAVDGTPHCIRDGDTGLLVATEDWQDLSQKLKLLLSDSELANKLGHNGRDVARVEFSEDAFVHEFEQMCRAVIGNRQA